MLSILLQALVLHITSFGICNDDSSSIILEDVDASFSLSTSAMASNSACGLVANAPILLVASAPLRKERLFFFMEDVGNEFGIWSLAGDKTMGGGNTMQLLVVESDVNSELEGTSDPDSGFSLFGFFAHF